MAGSRTAFAQARIQAAYAALPRETHWRQLRGARTLAAYLEEARGGPLRVWVKGFSSQSDAHAIERGLRASLVEAVQQTSKVSPQPWRAAIGWWRILPYLPLLASYRRARGLPAWAIEDPYLAPFIGANRDLDCNALAAGGFAVLVPHLGDPDAMTEHWLKQWATFTSEIEGGSGSGIRSLSDRLGEHMRGFSAGGCAQAWETRQRLRETLRVDFHRALMTPVIPFLYLSLLALDLERLRRALLDRACFSALPGLDEPPAGRKEAA
jgi:hypothetical protein